jgi:hypothetical protein
VKQEKLGAAEARQTIGLPRLGLVSAPIVFAAYTLTILLARDMPLALALGGGVANTIPTVLFGLAAYHMVGTWLVERPARVQIAGHLLLGSVYAALCYWLLLVMLAVVNSASLVRFNVQPFAGGVSLWQLLQNLTVYGLIAALAYIRPSAPSVTVLFEQGDAQRSPSLTRYFIRTGEDIQPIDVDTIISIAGADDYAEVRTLNGSHLVRLTLAQFEESLDAARFIRVHRSRIINVDCVVRAEPAGGGRMLLHMRNGEMITASRSGSRLFKEHVL